VLRFSKDSAVYGHLTAEQLIADKPISGKQNFIERHMPAVPKEYCPRGSTARAARM